MDIETKQKLRAQLDREEQLARDFHTITERSGADAKTVAASLERLNALLALNARFRQTLDEQ